MRTFGVIALLLLPTIANAQTETTRANRLSVGAMTEPAVGTVRLTGLGSVGSPHPQPIRGMLRHDGQVFLDDTGPINPVFLHAGDLISRWARGHHTEVRHILDLATRTGYAGIRVWTCLGGGEYWRSRKVVASRELLRSFLNELRARDLKAILSQRDMWNFTDPWAYADVIRDVLDPSVIAIVDAGNEAWQTGQRDPRELARWLARLNTNILTVTTSPPDATREMVERYRQGARVSEVHSHAGDPFDNVRRIWNAAYEANANVQGEPRGYGRNVSGYNQVDAHTQALMAVAAASSGQLYVFMSSPGVISDGQSRGRFDGGEAFDSMPGFAEVPALLARLPKDIGRYTLVHGGASQRGRRIFAVPSRGSDDTRADCAIGSPLFACVIYGTRWREVQLERSASFMVDEHRGDRGRIVIGRLN